MVFFNPFKIVENSKNFTGRKGSYTEYSISMTPKDITTKAILPSSLRRQFSNFISFSLPEFQNSSLNGIHISFIS